MLLRASRYTLFVVIIDGILLGIFQWEYPLVPKPVRLTTITALVLAGLLEYLLGTRQT